MPSRRELLAALGVSLVPLAGCPDADEPDGDTTPGDGPGPGRTAMTTETPSRGPGTTAPPTTTSTRPGTDTTATTTTTAGDRATPTLPPGEACGPGWPPTPAWRSEFDRRLGSPVAGSGGLFVPAGDAVLRVDPVDGATQWRQAGAEPDLVAASRDRVLTVGRRRAVALRAGSGVPDWLWSPPGEGAVIDAATVHAGTAYLAASRLDAETTADRYSRVSAIGLKTGEVRRTISLEGGRVGLTPARGVAANETGVYVTIEDEGIAGFAPDGTERWRRGGEAWYGGPVVTGSTVAQATEDTVFGFDTGTGRTRWTVLGSDRDLAAADGAVYAVGDAGPASPGTLSAIDAAGGATRWETGVPDCGGVPSVAGTLVAVPAGCDAAGRVSLVDVRTGCRYGTAGPGGPAVGVATDGDSVFLAHGSRGRQLRALPVP